MIQRLREEAAVGAPGGGTQGDLVTIEGLAPPSPADPGGQAEGLERPKAEEPAEEVQIPEEEVDWTEEKPEEPKKRRKIRRAEKRQRKAEKEAARKAKQEAKKKAKEEAKKELQESEPVHSTAADLQAAWESGNEESEGEFSFLSSTSCNISPEKGEAEEEAEPIRLKSVAKEPIRLKPTAKYKTVLLNATAKTKPICLKSVERNPIRLRSVTKGVRPDRHPFKRLINLEGKKGPRYSRPVQHQPTTTRRPGCIDAETGIEHRLSDTGRWLPVLGAAYRTGKPRSKASKYKQKQERKAKAIARKSKAPSQPPKEKSCGSGLQKPPWRERASGSGSAGSKN